MVRDGGVDLLPLLQGVRSPQGIERALEGPGVEGGDVAEVAVLTVPVETVADDEAVGQLEAGVVDRKVDDAAVWPVKKDADLEARGGAALQVPVDVAQSEPGVDDVLEDEDVSP